MADSNELTWVDRMRAGVVAWVLGAIGSLSCAHPLPELGDDDTGGNTDDDTGGDLAALGLSVSPIKRFDFSWAAVIEAEHYLLLESPGPGEPFVQVGESITGESISIERPLHLRHEASYLLKACNAGGCTDAAEVDVAGTLADAVGYVKASDAAAEQGFGRSVALSADGSTLVVGVPGENDGPTSSGGVYVFVRNGVGAWSQQAYVEASNADTDDRFGGSVALSEDGSTLAVGARAEDGNATVIGGDQDDDTAMDAGAAYVFVRNGAGAWSQQAYVKASNADAGDGFGWSVALSGDGDTLAVGAALEDVDEGGPAIDAGAVYVFVRNGAGAWSQQAYVKASNADAGDGFGWSVALSGDGDTLAVGALGEDGSSTGIGGDQADEDAAESGAVYVLVRSGSSWSQQAYVKASNADAVDGFGGNVALSGDGDTLAVGALGEDGSSTGIGGDEADEDAAESGAAYVLVRSGSAWSQQAYVKASNTGTEHGFGVGAALSEDGNLLVVTAAGEGGGGIGIGSDQANAGVLAAGAAYVLMRDGAGAWLQRSYVKASNPGAGDVFGAGVALSSDGSTLAVTAPSERSAAMGIGGDQTDNSAAGAGAVYLY